MAPKKNTNSATASAATSTPKPRSAKAKVVKDVSAVVSDVPATDPVVTDSTVSTEIAPTQLENIVNGITQLSAIVKDLSISLRAFQKEYVKLVKPKRGATATKRQPSGFAKPAKLSDELCVFLGEPLGAELARTSVTKLLNVYIKEHDLQNPENKKFIRPDAKLQALLAIPEGEALSYFNLQRYMKHLFKTATPVVATPVPAA
jgi:chromatin remodeling complex protein RSC6